jgi:hypothetical protein
VSIHRFENGSVNIYFTVHQTIHGDMRERADFSVMDLLARINAQLPIDEHLGIRHVASAANSIVLRDDRLVRTAAGRFAWAWSPEKAEGG